MSTFRDQVIAVLRAAPGSTIAQVQESLKAMGVSLGDREPSNVMYYLVQKGRVRFEGDRPRRYFAVDAKGVTPCAPATPLGPAPPVVTDADKQRAALAESILQHLVGLNGESASAEDVAADLDEGRQPVALAIAQLMREGKVTRKPDNTGRWVYGVRRLGEAIAPSPSPSPAKAQGAERVSSNGKPAPESFAKPSTVENTGSAKGGPGGGEPPPGRASAAAEPVAAAAPAAAIPPLSLNPMPPEPDTLGRVLERMRDALKEPATVNFPYALSLELDALEDLMGDACDQGLPHKAIKGLVIAHGSLRRALSALTPAPRP